MNEGLLPLDTLTERQRQVLRLVVQEYVQTAQPVGSSGVANRYELGLSPATIRNELAALERLGLLTHPHTSAGRVPTDLGYRFFVHHLVSNSALTAEEQDAIRRQFSVLPQDVEEWLRGGTSILARTSQSAALATAPRTSQCRYKHVELVHIQGTKALLVLVLQEGAVKQQLLDLDPPMEQGELSRLSNELNDQLNGLDAAQVAQHDRQLSPFARQVAEVVAAVMQRLDQNNNGPIVRNGLAEMLAAPEFADNASVRRFVRVLEEPALLGQIADSLPQTASLRVVISGDGHYEDLHDVSLVLARYGLDDRATGIVGVVGPVRMPYARTIGAVRLVSGLMSEKVEEMYGSTT
jgi:heat-inducible transcriptional repressor